MANALIYGFNAPFVGGPEKYLSRQEDEKIIKNDILQLLFTVPGERIYRPNFGVNLRNFVFEPLTEASVDSLSLEISDKIATYEPRVKVRNIDLERDEDNRLLKIKIVAYMTADPRVAVIIDRFISGADRNER